MIYRKQNPAVICISNIHRLLTSNDIFLATCVHLRTMIIKIMTMWSFDFNIGNYSCTSTRKKRNCNTRHYRLYV